MALTVLKMGCDNPGGGPKHYLQGRERALTALSERGSSTWNRPLNEGPVIVTAFNDRVHNTSHLCGDGCERLAAQVRIMPVPGHIAIELVTEAVLALTNGDLSCDVPPGNVTI